MNLSVNTSLHARPPARAVSPTRAPGGQAPLSLALREGTRKAHRLVESAGFVQALLRGVVDRRAYARLLAALLRVYSALERALERHRDHPDVRAIYLPALARRDALAQDLALYDPTRALLREPPSPATRAYVQRILQLEREAPELLVAHAYTRYLGDLSGGRVLRGLVQRVLRPPPGRGLEFYRFPAIPDPVAFKHDYRARLDTLGTSPARAQAIVAEATRAFDHNHALFRELEGSALRTVLLLLRSANPFRQRAHNAGEDRAPELVHT